MHQTTIFPSFQASLTSPKDLFVSDNATFAYYKKTQLRFALYVFTSILTCGISTLVLYWLPSLYIKLIASPSSPKDATYVIATDDISTKKPTICRIQKSQYGTSFIIFRQLRYIYNEITDGFYAVQYPQPSYNPTSNEINEHAIDLYGDNDTTFEKTPLYRLILAQIASPFFIFQVYSITLWLFDSYYQYSIAIFVVTAVSIALEVFEIHKSEKHLHKISTVTDTCWKKVNDNFVEIPATKLAPGDLIIIQEQKKIPADCLLVKGEVVVDESLLTGESIPIVRGACTLDCIAKSAEILAGTECIQSRDSPEAIVIRSGFRSAKGQLLRQIKFPSDTKFKFNSDTFKFICALFLVAFAGFAWTVPSLVGMGVSSSLISKRACDIITVCVPPALYFAMNVATSYSVRNLKKRGIMCTNTSRVNVNALVDTVVFDKTGTLTESSLSLDSIIPSKMATLQPQIVNLSPDALYENLKDTPIYKAIMSCHELSIVNGYVSGDILEVAMFNSTGATLFDGHDAVEQALVTLSQDRVAEMLENGDYVAPAPGTFVGDSVSSAPSTGELTTTETVQEYSPNKKTLVSIVPWVVGPMIQIHTRFEFINELRRSSVISSCDGKMQVFAKGALEAIWDICLPQTVPANIESIAADIASQGKRLLAVAYKNIYRADITREEAESNLIFGGFLVFENPIRASSFNTIDLLQEANINTLICSGDAALTAAAVGKALQIIDDKPQLVVEYEDGSFIYSIDAQKYAEPKQLTNYNVIITGDAFEHMLPEYQIEIETSDALTKQYSIKKLLNLGPDDRLELYRETRLDKVLDSCKIFARMSSTNKKQLVQILAQRNDVLKRRAATRNGKRRPAETNDSFVMFCGDGANDVCALKAAHTSISLSQAEASAASPFTYKGESIDCVETSIRIGRCALVSSIQSFKFIILYSCIQFTSLCMLYSLNCNLSDWQFLFIDLFMILPISALMSRHRPADSITTNKPSPSLISWRVISSVFAVGLICCVSQVLMFSLLLKAPWYVPTEVSLVDPNTYTLESTAVFLFSAYQYVGVALIYSRGGQFRSSLWRNWSFCLFCAIVVVFIVLMNFNVLPTVLIDLIELYELPTKWRIFIAISSAVSLSAIALADVAIGHVFNK